MKTRLTAVMVSMLVATAACSSSSPRRAAHRNTPTSSKSTTTTAAPPSVTTSATIAPVTSSTIVPCPALGTSGRTDGPLSPAGLVLLTDVRIASVTCADSVTFTFRATAPAGTPPYIVEPASPPFAQGGSGAPISVRGSRFLRVRFQPAYTADLNVATAPATYTGPHRFDPTTARTVRSVVLYDASEGVVGWIIGLDGSGRYTVTTTASPPSLTVRVSR